MQAGFMKKLISATIILISMIAMMALNGCSSGDSKDEKMKLIVLLAALKRTVPNDLNYDGFSDIAIGAPNYDSDRANASAGNNTGRVYIFFGAPNGIHLWNQDAGAPPANYQKTLTGERADSYFGYSIAYADVNNDKITDLIVSAPYYNLSGVTGRVYVYYGGASIPSTASAIIDGNFNGFGQKIVLGDLNNDSYPELIAASYDLTTYTGRVAIFKGSASGFEASPSVTLDGEKTNSSFGQFMRTGDLNGDGYVDLVVAATNYDVVTLNVNDNNGRVYVYYGSASGISTTPSVTLTGEAVNHQLGRYFAIGDIDGDKIADLAIGVPAYGTNSTGRIYVYLGSSSGIPTSASFTIDAPTQWSQYGQNIVLCDINGDSYKEIYNYGRIFSGVTNNATNMTIFSTGMGNDYYGYSADVNGDGNADLVLRQSNQVTVYYGSKNFSTLTYAHPLNSIAGENGTDGFGVIE
jgi:hypothetical protein